MILQNKPSFLRFCLNQDVVVRNYKTSPRPDWRYFQNQYRQEENCCIEEPPFSRCDHVVCVSAHEHSCHRIYVGGSGRLECVVGAVVDMHYCWRVSYPQLGKLWVSRWRQVFLVWFLTERYLLVTVLTTVASSLVPALQGMRWMMTSPRKQQTVEEDCWKKPAPRRAPLVIFLKSHGPIWLVFENQYCEAECPCSLFLSSASACYWDPEVVLRIARTYFPLCSFRGEYNAFSDHKENHGLNYPSCLEVYHNLLYDLPKKTKNNSRMRLPVSRFGWGRHATHERYGTVLHRTSTCGDDCWIEHGIQVVCVGVSYVRGVGGNDYCEVK